MESKFEVGVMSDLFDAGKDSEGRSFVAERFYVVVVSVRTGRRWKHHLAVNGARREICDETLEPYFVDLREDAVARLDRLATRVRDQLATGGRLDATHWDEVDPVYGSDAYVEQDIELERVFAERAAYFC